MPMLKPSPVGWKTVVSGENPSLGSNQWNGTLNFLQVSYSGYFNSHSDCDLTFPLSHLTEQYTDYFVPINSDTLMCYSTIHVGLSEY